MKHTKKLFALLLALTLVLSLAATAFAVGENTGTITINNAVDGNTYKVYQIFSLESYSADGAHAYKIVEKWRTFFDVPNPGSEYIEIDAQGYVKPKAGTGLDNTNVEEFAKEAAAWAETKSIAEDRTSTAASGTVSFTNLPLGYYLVDTTLGTLCSLDTTKPNANIMEKNTVPENKKEIVENASTVTANSVNVGDTVNFQSTIKAQKGAQNYVFTDTMSAGLTLDTNSIRVKVQDTLLTANTHYTLDTTGTDGCTFKITFKQDYLDTIENPTDIVVTYSATLNAQAVIGGEGNENTAKLGYGNDPKTQVTPDSKTKTYTWEFSVLKFTNTTDIANTKKPLAGAKFALYTTDQADTVTGLPAENTKISFTKSTTQDTYTRCADDTPNAVKEFTTPAEGIIKLQGLDAGTYYLWELEAPAGYNKLAGPVKIDIEETIDNQDPTKITSSIKVGDVKISGNQVEVENQTGTELPSTGGIGTTIFYIAGAALALTAVILLVTKKRMTR